MVKKNLGKEVNKSIKIMEELLECLKQFAHMPLKRGLSLVEGEEDITKAINESSEIAFSLKNKIEDLKKMIECSKDKKSNSRFAKEVVNKFLASSI